MKRKLLSVIVSGMVVGNVFGQSLVPDPATPYDPLVHTQSLSFSGVGQWTPGTMSTVNVSLTFNGYSSYGLSYWVQLPIALAPFVSVTDVQYFTFLTNNQGPAFGSQFNEPSGASPGYLALHRDLGAIVTPVIPANAFPPGTYPITTLTFALSAGATSLIGQSFTMLSTTVGGRASEVTDTDFMDNNIPAAPFVITIVPEPCPSALLGVAGLGSALMIYRRRRK